MENTLLRNELFVLQSWCLRMSGRGAVTNQTLVPQLVRSATT